MGIRMLTVVPEDESDMARGDGGAAATYCGGDQRLGRRPPCVVALLYMKETDGGARSVVNVTRARILSQSSSRARGRGTPVTFFLSKTSFTVRR